jgi:hypothetical protein
MKYEITFEMEEASELNDTAETIRHIKTILQDAGAKKVEVGDYSITPEMAKKIDAGEFLDVRGQVVKWD